MILGHSFRKCRDGLDIHDCDGMGDILRPDMALFFDLKCGGYVLAKLFVKILGWLLINDWVWP